jgi:hypothetical protein
VGVARRRRPRSAAGPRGRVHRRVRCGRRAGWPSSRGGCRTS